MKIYPYSSALFLNDQVFNDYGGTLAGTTPTQRANVYRIAEIQVSNYIGTLLQPTLISGTFNYAGKKRIVTDYGYVWSILNLDVLSQNVFTSNCDLKHNPGCAFIYEDTFGYIDVRQTLSISNIGLLSWFTGLSPLFPVFSPLADMINPYQFQITYTAGLPTGTSIQSPMLMAMTVMAQINLNELAPGAAGANEGVGDVGILEYQDGGMRGYREKRTPSDIRKTILGSSAKSNYAARLIDSVVKKARPSLRM